MYSLDGEVRVGENELTVSFINDYNHPIDGTEIFIFMVLVLKAQKSSLNFLKVI